MIFNSSSKNTVKLKKNNFFIIQEKEVFRNPSCPYFAITNIFDNWGVIHLPSERAVISCLPSKESTEKFMDYLSEQIDLTSLIFLDPRYETLREIAVDVELAYRKYLAGCK